MIGDIEVRTEKSWDLSGDAELNGILTFVGLFLISEERPIEPENIYQ